MRIKKIKSIFYRLTNSVKNLIKKNSDLQYFNGVHPEKCRIEKK